MSKISLLVCLLLLSSSVFAFSGNQFTGNQLERLCTEKNSDNDEMLCIIFFVGYTNGLITGAQVVDWNAPKNMFLSPSTIRKVFLNMMKKEPIIGDQSPDIIITYGLIQEGILKLKPKLEEERKK